MTAETAPQLSDAGFGLYLHWPFCAAKCPYCDFNSHVVDAIDHARFLRAYLSELEWWADRTRDRILGSVFLGGGTPSLMRPEDVSAILTTIRRLWRVSNDLEVTLEANPTSAEAGRFRAFAEAGVTRMSVGLQALDDTDLRRLGRMHSADEGRAAFEMARDAVGRVSFDLIYGRQDQTEDEWRKELRHALGFAGSHLSLYQLTIEDGTTFAARHARGLLRGLPDEDRAVALYEMTQDLCDAAGLPRYETSNHAASGEACRHNLIYWHGGDWLGIGPGAHGRVRFDGGRRPTVAARAPGAWLTAVESEGHGADIGPAMAIPEVAEEYLMMALRLTEGADLSRLAQFGWSVPDTERRMLVDLELLIDDPRRLRTTERGALLLDAILGRLLAQPAG